MRRTILYANRAAGELFGVEPDTLIGKPITDLVRPAYRAGMRKHVGVGRRGQRAVAAVRGPAHQQRRPRGCGRSSTAEHLTFGGEPALMTVARDITHRKSLWTSLGRGKLQARITLESIGEGCHHDGSHRLSSTT